MGEGSSHVRNVTILGLIIVGAVVTWILYKNRLQEEREREAQRQVLILRKAADAIASASAPESPASGQKNSWSSGTRHSPASARESVPHETSVGG